MLWSNSTTVSFGQSFFWISSRVTRPPDTLHQHQQDLEGLFLKTNLSISGTQLARLQIELKGPDPYAV